MSRFGALTLLAAACLTGSLLVVSPATSAQEGEGSAPPTADAERCLKTGLPELSSGEQARAELKEAGMVRDVAEEAGVEPRDLRRALKADESLHVDECGKMLYIESGPEPEVLAASAALEAHDNPQSQAGSDKKNVLKVSKGQNAFALNSRPGAPYTIFLDFDGGPIPSGWRNLWSERYGVLLPATAAPFGDSDPAFSAEELNAIKAIWEGVAEDFSPFNVNVTTQQPPMADLERSNEADTRYGVTALISPRSDEFALCRCSGLGYVGTFDWIGPDPQGYKVSLNRGDPAYVKNPRFAVGTISHEVGHNFGLLHDSTAESEYAPKRGVWGIIMGGATGLIEQFSNGDFPGSLNSQDDLDVIAAEGPQRIPDDHEDTPQAATAFTNSVNGLLTTRQDVDWFTFTAQHAKTKVEAAPRSWNANANLELHITNANGQTVATVNPAATSDKANLSAVAEIATTPGQQYFVRIDGTGETSAPTIYSDYGSVGQYSVTVSKFVAPPPPPPPPPPPVNPGPAKVAPIITAGALEGAHWGPRKKKRWAVWGTWDVSPDTVAPTSYKVVLKGKKIKVKKKKAKRNGKKAWQYRTPTLKETVDAPRRVAAFLTENLPKRGKYRVTVTATNAYGTSKKYAMSIKAKKTRGKAAQRRMG
ncbi:MAG: hypothetical protein GY813_12085 [Halieaceae bacterium]|nr:hypothetical protein [Halieaceae bacterium]